MNPLLLDHLWQSSAVLAGIGLLTLFFCGNGAHVRHAMWTTASLKFLLPFALLSVLGQWFAAFLASPPAQPRAVQVILVLSRPFPQTNNYLLSALLIWIAGTCGVTILWLSRWLKLRAALCDSREVDLSAPMPVKMTLAPLEPGLVGIFRPVLLLPEGIADKLSRAELQSIIAHETCHLRRRDNLWASLHMLVEAVFWFWPPVWWLGTRLIAEREKACDEAVLAAGSDPQTSAESILKVCRHYVSSPLACAAGVSGADLKQRMEDIMGNIMVARLNIPKKMLLAASAAVALALPLVEGVFLSSGAAAQAGTEETTSRASFMTKVAGTPPAFPGGCDSVSQLDQAVLARAPLNAKPVLDTHKPVPYPAVSQASGEQGTVQLTVFIGADGAAIDAVVSKSSGNSQLDRCAASWVKRQWHWQPLLRDGKAVASKSYVTTKFQLVPSSP